MTKYDVIIETCITVEAETYEEAVQASDKAHSEFWKRISPADFPNPIYIEQTDLIQMEE
jgi:hypothetical protein